MAQAVRLGKRFQLVLPKKIRQRLGLREGDVMLVEVTRRGILLVPKPQSYTRHLAGLHREVWQGVDVDEYLREERKTWR
jgi:AbrB family looped-hinge helix DNA binding protein